MNCSSEQQGSPWSAIQVGFQVLACIPLEIEAADVSRSVKKEFTSCLIQSIGNTLQVSGAHI